MVSRTPAWLALALVGPLVWGACTDSSPAGEPDQPRPDNDDDGWTPPSSGCVDSAAFGSTDTWYYRQTLVEVPPATTFTFVGVSSPLIRVGFERAGKRLVAKQVGDNVIVGSWSAEEGKEVICVDWAGNDAPEANNLDPLLTGDATLSHVADDLEGGASRFVSDGADYFDYTVAWELDPQWCFGGTPAECVAQTLLVRHSFRRATRPGDYAPGTWGDARQARFRFGHTEPPESRVYRMGIWGPVEAGGGRVPSPIGVALSPDHPEDLLPATQAVVGEWNRAFRRVIAHACDVDVPTGTDIDAVPVGGGGEDCATLGTIGEVPDMVLLDTNDDGAVRLGDLRHHTLWWVPPDQATGPAGHTSLAVDSESGEIVSASAIVFGATVQAFSQHATRIIDVLDGFLTVEDLLAGGPEGSAAPSFPRHAGLPAEAFMTASITGGRAIVRPGPDSGQPPAPAGRSRRIHADEMSKRGVMLAQFADDAVIGLALEFHTVRDRGEVTRILHQRIFEGLALHELGHAFGLRHNFKGSYDSMNYPDEYWDLRNENLGDENRDHLAELEGVTGLQIGLQSRFTETQQRLSMREWGYASVMDYGMKFNSAFHGLGRYDQAAVLMAYADAVEVFEVPRPEVVERLGSFLVRQGADPDVDADEMLELDMESPEAADGGRLLSRFNYTHLPYLLGGLDGLRRRRVIGFETLKALRARPGRQTDRPLEVPYLSCDEADLAIDETCNRWDLGADPFEIAGSALKSYDNDYYFTHFRRGRAHFEPVEIVERLYVQRLRLLAELYRAAVPFYVDQDPLPDPVQSYLFGDAGVLSAQALLNVVTSPSYGIYEKDPAGVWRLQNRDLDAPFLAGQFVVHRGEGRNPFDRISGDQIIEVGHAWDVVAALWAMTGESYASGSAPTDVGVGIPSFPNRVRAHRERLFDAIVLGEASRIGPRVVNGSLLFTGLFSLDDDPPDGEELEVKLGAYRDIALRYGMAYLRGERRWVDRQRVFLIGTPQEVSPGEGFETVRFADPGTGQVYGAHAALDLGDDWPPPPVVIIRELAGLSERISALAQDDPEREELARTLAERVAVLEQIRVQYELYSPFDTVAEMGDLAPVSPFEEFADGGLPAARE